MFASLENSALSGNLRSVNVSENFIARTPAVVALKTFIVHAKAVTTLDISALMIEKTRDHEQLIQNLSKSQIAQSLVSLNWNSDIKVDETGRGAIEQFL